MMTSRILILSLIMSAFSCSNEPEKEQGSEVSSNTENTFKEDKTKVGIDSLNMNASNETDVAKTLKQGEIITRNRQNTIVSIMNYSNDTLDGYYFKWEGMQEDGYYKKGKKHGYFRTYYGDKMDEKVMLSANYRNDTLLWRACPASDQLYIFNPKGFSSPFDSIYIEALRPDSTIWYEGLFLNNKEIGKHSIYKKSGELYAIADYEKNLVYFPNKDTVSLQEYGFKKIED